MMGLPEGCESGAVMVEVRRKAGGRARCPEGRRAGSEIFDGPLANAEASRTGAACDGSSVVWGESPAGGANCSARLRRPRPAFMPPEQLATNSKNIETLTGTLMSLAGPGEIRRVAAARIIAGNERENSPILSES